MVSPTVYGAVKEQLTQSGALSALAKFAKRVAAFHLAADGSILLFSALRLRIKSYALRERVSSSPPFASSTNMERSSGA